MVGGVRLAITYTAPADMRTAYGQFLPPDKISCHLLMAETT